MSACPHACTPGPVLQAALEKIDLQQPLPQRLRYKNYDPETEKEAAHSHPDWKTRTATANLAQDHR